MTRRLALLVRMISILVVAVAFGTAGMVALSHAAGDPLAGWQWKNLLPQGNQINSLAYGNGRFVGVGDGATILVSSDGAAWTRLPVSSITTSAGVAVAPTDSKTGAFWLNLKGVTYGNGQFVAVGDANGSDTKTSLSTILTSTDGLHWIRQADIKNSAGTSTVGAGLKSVTWATKSDGINQFVAVGAGGAIITSLDGSTWRSVSASPTSKDLQSVAYANYTVVAVGSAGTLVTLLNSGEWIAATSGTNDLHGITYGSDLFVAVGASGSILTSPDGITWTSRLSGTGESLNAVTHDGTSVFSVAGDKGLRLRSSNGTAWTTAVATATVPNLSALTYAGGVFVAAGASGSMATSSDAAAWTQASSGPSAGITGIAYGLGLYVAVTDSGAMVTSTDGASWTKITPSTTRMNGVAFGGSYFVAVGSGGAVLTSYDGNTWNAYTQGIADLNAIVYDGGRFVVVGNSGTVLTSSDGSSWTAATFVTATTKNFYGVTLGGDKSIVAVGQTGTIAYSTYNGATAAWGSWKTVTSGTNDLLAVSASHTATGAVLYVAVGRKGAIYATSAQTSTAIDLSKWGSRSVPTNYKSADLLAVASDGNDNYGTFVVVGTQAVTDSVTKLTTTYPVLLTSADGTTWKERYSPFTGKLAALLYVNKSYLAGGADGTLLLSDRLDKIAQVAPASHDFGSQPLSTPSLPKTFTISNQGIDSLTVNDVSVSGSAFTLSSLSCGSTPVVLAAGASCTFSALFNPGAILGAINEQITILTDDARNPSLGVPVSGIGGMFIYAVSGSNGSISSADTPAITPVTLNGKSAYPVTLGSPVAFAVNPGAGYYVQEVKVDGVSIGGVSSYTFPAAGVSSVPSSIEASFSNASHTIHVTSGSGGTVNPGTVLVPHGQTQAFSITPSIGYKVTSIKVDGVVIPLTSMYTFAQVSGNHNMDVTFSKISDTVTTFLVTNGAAGAAGGSITEGTISPAGSCTKTAGTSSNVFTCDYGATISFAVAATTGYRLLDVIVDGVSLGSSTTAHTFSSIREAHEIKALFSNQTAITVTTDGNGTVSPTPTSGVVLVTDSSTPKFTFTPTSGYVVRDVKVDGVSQGAVSSYTFSAITATHSIDVTFTPVQYSITMVQSPNGIIAESTGASSPMSVGGGASKVFTITPATGYEIADVTVDGASVGPVATHVFSAVSANHAISAVFRAKTSIIDFSISGGGGTAVGGVDFSLRLQNSLMGTGRRWHTATLLNSGSVLVSGGFDSLNVVTGAAELYGSSANAWSSAGSIPGRVYHTSTLLADGTAVVAGGWDGVSQTGSTVRYSPATGVWSTEAPLSPARDLHAATLLNDGRLMVVGGRNTDPVTGTTIYLQDVNLYDPSTGVWSAAVPLGAARALSVAVRLADGSVLVTGGGSPARLASVEQYDPAAGSWTTKAALANSRYLHTATLLPDGRVLVAGGYDTVGLAGAELYNPATDVWSPAPSLASARYHHAAVLLNDGRVLITGGRNGATVMNTSELYDPVSNTWSSAASMNKARDMFTATLLPNGTVLVIGGVDAAGTVLNDTETYDPATNTWTLNTTVPYAIPLNAAASASINELDPAALSAVGTAAGSTTGGSYDPSANTARIVLTKAGGFATGGKFLSVRFTSPAATVGSIGQVTVNSATDSSGKLLATPVAITAAVSALPRTTATPAGGLYSSTQSVALTTSSSGATIYYSVSGIPATTSSNIYKSTTPISISTTTTLKYFAVDAAGNQEALRQETYVIDKTSPKAVLAGVPATLTNSPNATVTVSGTDVVSYKYQMDGGSWSVETPVATPISLTGLVDGVRTLAVIGKDTAGNWQATSATTSAKWTVDTATPATTASPAGGVYHTDQTVTLTKSKSTATVYYTLDGTLPTTSSMVYAAPLSITKDTVLTYYSVDTAGNSETPKSASYTLLKLDVTPPLSPTLDPSPVLRGTVSSNASSVAVSINGGASANAVIAAAAGAAMTTWSYTVPALSTGLNTISATASDGTNSYAQTARIVYGQCTRTGNLSGTGTLSMADVLAELRFAVGLASPTATQLTCGDVFPLDALGVPSGDGAIDVSDALLLLRRIVTGSW